MTRKEQIGVAKAIGFLAAGPLVLLMTPIALPLTIWNGYVLRVLWGWFVTPALGLKPLSLAAATGLVVVAHFLTHRADYSDVKQKAWYISLFGCFVGPLATLCVGWLVRWLLGAP